MSRKRILTQQMLTAAVIGLDPAHRTDKAIAAELWRLFNVRIGISQLRHWMSEWEIYANVKDIGRREAKQAVANTLVGEEMEELRSQIGTLNQAEGIIGKLLDKADEALNQIVLTPDIPTVRAVLGEAKKLMLASSEVRQTMADIQAGMGEEKPDPDASKLVPRGENVIGFAEMAEKFKSA